MSELRVNGIRFYYEEHGEGPPILCIHGTSSSSLLWAPAVEELSALGRVIAYDRRGCHRSERPQPYERTSVAEHADDAAALLDALGATPAIVIGRSYGAEVALDLVLRYPDRVRALVLLEPGAVGLSPKMDAWSRRFVEQMRDVAATQGADAVGRALIDGVLGPAAWDSFPEQIRRIITDNSAAILAEVMGEWLAVDRAALAGIDRPTLLVSGADSLEGFRDVMDELAAAMPAARLEVVEGDHFIDPAHPTVISFLQAQTELLVR